MTNGQAKEQGRNLVAPMVAATVGLVVGVAVGMAIRTAGDEAPIRVKNGSVDIELLHKAQELEDEDGNGKNWKFKGNVSHGSDAFDVYFKSTSADCTLQGVSGKKVLFTTQADNGTTGTIEITSPGGKTKIKSKEKLNKISAGLLKDEAAGVYVASVDVYDSNPNPMPVCKVAKGESLSVVLLDR